MSERETTNEQIRAALKAGFYAGFKAAHAVSVDGAWEECRERWALDRALYQPTRIPKDKKHGE